MILLAIDTSSYAGGVALIDTEERRPVAVVETASKLDQSRKLLDSIDFALKKAGLTLDGLGAVVVSVGPGSFTGVRIGLTHAKMLAWTRGLPLIGIGALAGLAARQPADGRPVCALIPARRGEVFAGVFRVGVDEKCGAPAAELVIEPFCAEASEALTRVADNVSEISADNGTVVFCGAGADRHWDEIQTKFGPLARLAPPWLRYSSPISIGLLALGALHRQDFHDPVELEPVYIRAEEDEFTAAPPAMDL